MLALGVIGWILGLISGCWARKFIGDHSGAPWVLFGVWPLMCAFLCIKLGKAIKKGLDE